jgi:hypothetical protein
MSMKPKHTHDCERCQYLGTVFDSGGMLDGYYCNDGFLGGSVVLRQSSEGSDYWSIPLSMLKPDEVAGQLGNADSKGYVGKYIVADFLVRKAGLR